MKNTIKNWKTSLLGGGVLTAGIGIIVADPNNWKEGVLAMLVGLIGIAAKDSGVTGAEKKGD